MAKYPWRELSEKVVEVTDLAAALIIPRKRTVTQLRNLFARCSASPDAEEALCYQGAKALLAQYDGDIERAIEHREKEALMIMRLYTLEEVNSTDGWLLQDYQLEDIRKRTRILDHLRIKLSEQAVARQPA